MEEAIRDPDTDTVIVALAEPPARGGGDRGGGSGQIDPLHEAARAQRRRGAAHA
jgi:hypothetical protein